MMDDVAQLLADRPEGFERRLHELLSGLDAPTFEQARSLLLLLRDSLPNEARFCLIHAAEAAPTDTYVRALVAALPTLQQQGAACAKHVLKRLLNSPACLEELVVVARAGADAEREALARTLRNLRKNAPAFAARCDDVLQRLGLT